MKLYHLEFRHGYYDDAWEAYLGVYSSEEKRELAIQEHKLVYG
jgi:hypothetical protein